MKLRFLFPGRWNPEYLGPCYANIPLGPVGNPLSETPDITGARERGPLSVTASNPRAPHLLHPCRAYPGIHTALGWGEGAETPTRSRRPRPRPISSVPPPATISFGLSGAFRSGAGLARRNREKNNNKSHSKKRRMRCWSECELRP